MQHLSCILCFNEPVSYFSCRVEKLRGCWLLGKLKGFQFLQTLYARKPKITLVTWIRDLFPTSKTKCPFFVILWQAHGVSCVPTVTLVTATADTVRLGHVSAVTATVTLTPTPWPTATAPLASVSSVSTTLEVSTVTSVSQVNHACFHSTPLVYYGLWILPMCPSVAL